MTWRAGMYHVASRKTTPQYAQNPQFRASFSPSLANAQCIDIVGQFLSTRFLFPAQLSYVLYKSWRLRGASLVQAMHPMNEASSGRQRLGRLWEICIKNSECTCVTNFYDNHRSESGNGAAGSGMKTTICARRCRRKMQWQKSLSTEKLGRLVCRSVIVWSISQVWSWSASTPHCARTRLPSVL